MEQPTTGTAKMFLARTAAFREDPKRYVAVQLHAYCLGFEVVVYSHARQWDFFHFFMLANRKRETKKEVAVTGVSLFMCCC